MQQQSQALAPPRSQHLASQPLGVVPPQPPASGANPRGDAVAANPILAALVRSVHSIHRRTSHPARIAESAARTLRLFLGHPDLLSAEQRLSDPGRYRQHVLYVADDGAFSIVALVWRAGQTTSVHDHVSWCAIGVHHGREQEVHYALAEHQGAACLVPTGSELFTVGATAALTPPGDIHLVTNPGPGEAISIHIYGADVRRLGSSIRRSYNLPVMA